MWRRGLTASLAIPTVAHVKVVVVLRLQSHEALQEGVSIKASVAEFLAQIQTSKGGARDRIIAHEEERGISI